MRTTALEGRNEQRHSTRAHSHDDHAQPDSSGNRNAADRHLLHPDKSLASVAVTSKLRRLQRQKNPRPTGLGRFLYIRCLPVRIVPRLVFRETFLSFGTLIPVDGFFRFFDIFEVELDKI